MCFFCCRKFFLLVPLHTQKIPRFPQCSVFFCTAKSEAAVRRRLCQSYCDFFSSQVFCAITIIEFNAIHVTKNHSQPLRTMFDNSTFIFCFCSVSSQIRGIRDKFIQNLANMSHSLRCDDSKMSLNSLPM